MRIWLYFVGAKVIDGQFSLGCLSGFEIPPLFTKMSASKAVKAVLNFQVLL